MQKKFTIFLSLLALIFIFCGGQSQMSPLEQRLNHLFQKQKVTIAVMDSGLGGLSIVADVSKRLKEWKIFSEVQLIFFNALFSIQGGYNSLKTREEKIHVFDSALKSLENNYRPGLLLIGCNTLSTLFEDTSFAKETAIPVIGIVEAGVELIVQKLKAFPESRVILFGTQTTVSEATHQKNLVVEGFAPERVILQACPELVDYIERGYESEETEMLISAYVEEALQKLKIHQTSFHVSLNCTHYGYSLDLWENAFSSAGVKPLSILNPNAKMIDFLFQPQRKNQIESTDISIRVVSMVKISEERMDSIGTWLQKISPQTAEALRNYEWVPGLFEWKKFVKSNERKSD